MFQARSHSLYRDRLLVFKIEATGALCEVRTEYGVDSNSFASSAVMILGYKDALNNAKTLHYWAFLLFSRFKSLSEYTTNIFPSLT
jgi:hypothetical protein